MNNLDKQYQDLLQTILDYGVDKKDRTGTGTKSIFGYTIRHNMKDGFPLLTTKKMAWNQIVTELLWFLRGDTNIKFLVDNGCHIWDGDAYKNYCKWYNSQEGFVQPPVHNIKMFIERIKTDDEFAKKWGDLGPIYGRMWRAFDEDASGGIDQIASLINDLKTNPDSKRLLVTAWHPGYNQWSVLPPCHYGFQVYTRELSSQERKNIYDKSSYVKDIFPTDENGWNNLFNDCNIPKRTISLMWNQRSVDTFLGLPFNIASYGLLLEIIAKAVNMVPDQLIGNLGDVHLYSNHIEQAKEQIGRELSITDRVNLANNNDINISLKLGDYNFVEEKLDKLRIQKHTREPFPLPTLNINTEWWPTEGGECGVGPLDAVAVFNGFTNDNFCKCLLEEDIQLGNYQSHPTIKAPLSN